MRRQKPARWQAIEARLGRELTIWLATVREDGRPHLIPIWYIWLNDKFYIATGDETQKFINMRYNQHVALSLPDTSSVIMVEGEAHVADRPTVDAVAEYFFHKYEWDFRYDETAVWRLIEITPHKILAWGDGYEDDGTRIL